MSLHEQILTSMGRGPDKTYQRLAERLGPDKAAEAVLKAGIGTLKIGLGLSDAVQGELIRSQETLRAQEAEIEGLKRACDSHAGQVSPLAAERKALEAQVEALREARAGLEKQLEDDAAQAEVKVQELVAALEEAGEASARAKAERDEARDAKLDQAAELEGMRDMILRLEGENAKLKQKAAQRDEFAAQLAELKRKIPQE